MRPAVPNLTLTADHGAWSADLIWLAETRFPLAVTAQASAIRTHLASNGPRRANGCRDTTCRI